jgi:hypothetical protein
MGSIQAALNMIASLKPSEKVNYTRTAIQHGVDRRTLARRHQAITTSRGAAAQQRQALNDQQELELVEYIYSLTKRALPPTRAMIRNFGSQIAGRELGICWANRFIKRHDVNLISAWATGIDHNRHEADSIIKYELYFNLLREKIDEYNIQPRYTYNMDEKGFLLGVIARSKRVFGRWLYEKGKIQSISQDGSREWITLLACICADGTALEPSLIYQSATSSIQEAYSGIRFGNRGVLQN